MLKYKEYAKDVEKLKADCERYFEFCDNENASGKLKKPYTVSGLCLHLGVSRTELTKLAVRRSHADAMRSVMMKIESFIEENALLGALANNPALYSLKYNFGWSDKPHALKETEDKTLKISLDGECDKWAN